MEDTARMETLLARYEAFLDEVAGLDRALAGRGAGTPWQPALDEHGRMHSEVWEARREVQRRSAAAGLYTPHMPEEVGGLGLSRVECMRVEELVYRRAGLGLGLCTLAWTEGPSPNLAHLGPEGRERFLGPLMRGETSCAFANTEPDAGSDVLSMSTRAERDGDDWVITGRKAWITNAHFCDVAQVVAVTEPGAGSRSLTMFMVEADRDGFARGPDAPTIMDDGLTGELVLDGVRVPDANRIGEVGQGLQLALTWINWRRMCRGGMCAGWGAWLRDRAVARAKSRRSGGRPIGELQAVQHLLADLDADVYAARALSLEAQRELDALGPFAVPIAPEAIRLVSLIALVNDEAFFRVTDRAVQIHGATGLGRGTPEEKLFRVSRSLRIPAGTVEIQRNAIARALLR
ncbi:MAG TPA: acyl-CoA dehydrogenase [Miltoncostaea sp.]|nr:acyl-CoA dehydrogenase [Miltoncostaea sp.]